MASKTAYHHGNLKPALIAAALKEIAREGPDGFSLREVARRAGVSAPAVYRHFASKEDLLAAVAIECSERLEVAISESLAQAPDDPLEQFRARGIAIVMFAAANPEHFRAMAMPGMAKHQVRTKEQHQAEIAQIEAAQRAGAIASDLPASDILIAGHCLVSGLAHLIVEGRLGPVDGKRARELAIAISSPLGVGLIPRDEDVHDPFRNVIVRGRRATR